MAKYRIHWTGSLDNEHHLACGGRYAFNSRYFIELSDEDPHTAKQIEEFKFEDGFYVEQIEE